MAEISRKYDQIVSPNLPELFEKKKSAEVSVSCMIHYQFLLIIFMKIQKDALLKLNKILFMLNKKCLFKSEKININ